MFTINLKGGLGNQLFQIAFLEYLKKKTSINFFIKQSDIKRRISEHSSDSYFDTILKNWSSLTDNSVPNKVFHEQNLYPQNWIDILSKNNDSIIEFDGYFQNHEYITDEFLEKLSFPTDIVSKYATIQDSVFIHIRGGDYVNHPMHDVKLKEYYSSAIEQFPNDTEFAVFTNDTIYSNYILQDLNVKYSFIHEDEVTTLYLMSLCRGAICANSSLSWWGARLNLNRKIILPSKWFNDTTMHTNGYYFPEATIMDIGKWSFIDKVVYINLDHRTDRNEHMQKMTATFGNKCSRFSAIRTSYGAIGCTMSHIQVLKMAVQEKWKNVLILEDDAEWNKFDQGYSILKQLATNPYDVILLGGSCVSCNPVTYKLYSSQTTTAYLVNSHYFQTLIDNFTQSLHGLISDKSAHETYAVDMYWKRLQQRDNWFIVHPPLIYQRPDYSDITLSNVDYRSLMNIEKEKEQLPILPKRPEIRFLKKL